MNKQDIELAEQAEAFADRNFKGEPFWSEAYESKLIELVRADEREACAKVCETLADDYYDCTGVANAITAAIRARGNT